MENFKIVSITLIFLAFSLVTAAIISQEVNFTFDGENIDSIIASTAQLIEFSAWPVVVLLIALNFKTTISSAISQLANRVTRAGKDGVVFSQKIQHSDEDSIRDKSNLKEVLEDTKIIKDYVDLVKPEFDALAESTNLSKTDTYLAKAAEFYLYWQLEKVYRTIFGSQIKLLQHLASHGLNSDKHLLQKYYNEASLSYPDFYSFYSYESWLLFLSNHSMIKIEEDQISLTLEGQTLINYIHSQDYSFDKTH